MASVTGKTGSFSVRAYAGDCKTLLAFDLADKKALTNLAGFTIQVKPQGQSAYYLLNELRFQTPGNHAQDPSEPATSSINAPFHKFNWVHVPGSSHQGVAPFLGPYTYTVTPRYFDSKQSMQPLDPTLSASVTINVGPFVKGALTLGFTRGFVQSEAFVHHFGLKGLIRPAGNALLYDTTQQAGANAKGQTFTFADEYAWSGYSARKQIFGALNQVLGDATLSLDMFAYDLDEPDVLNILLKLAAQGRVRIILDNASLHHNAKGTTPEDQFEQLFTNAMKAPAAILRGKFGRYAHDKVLIISNKQGPVTVLTGSTNFAITGLYVNSNHVLVFNDAAVAGEYEKVFEEAWNDGAKEAFNKTALAATPFSAGPSSALPKMTITFSPHTAAQAETILGGLVNRVNQEKTKGNTIGNVLFAVMQLDDGDSMEQPFSANATSAKSTSSSSTSSSKTTTKKTPALNPVYTALQALHANQTIFSYGISDSPGGIYLYIPGKSTGVLVTGKPGNTLLPPPFDQVADVAGHQIHHKFVVCGVNGADPVVYCGSSNLALGGEQENGDNLLEIHDADVATAFAIEALALVDHFDFLDTYSRKSTGSTGGSSSSSSKTATAAGKPQANATQAAESAGWFLSTDNKWTQPWFDSSDLKCMERRLFA
ncbi:MAG TPA: phospholipase D-like domain-containing protein [Candidatus Limnocylindrales bacterium]|nr:phospholipase D-like domain-containing protein [Candidatus Limnocylindrales bacterium]